MDFIGPVKNEIGLRPLRVFCDVCNTKILAWQCYACGGMYCGLCISLHKPQIIAPNAAALASGNSFWNFAEEINECDFLNFQQLSSEMALDPAGANERFCKFFACAYNNGSWQDYLRRCM